MVTSTSRKNYQTTKYIKFDTVPKNDLVELIKCNDNVYVHAHNINNFREIPIIGIHIYTVYICNHVIPLKYNSTFLSDGIESLINFKSPKVKLCVFG